MLSQDALSIFVLAGFLSASVIYSGFGPLITQYFQAKARIPRALNSSASLPNGLSQDATYHGTQRAMLTESQLLSLERDKEQLENGARPNKVHLKELESDRTEFSNTYSNKDGSKTKEVYYEPQNYIDSKGKWQHINNSISLDASGNPVSSGNNWATLFDSSDTGVGLSINSNIFRMVPLGAKKVKPVIENDSSGNQYVIYKDLWKDTDLRYDVTSLGLKESIILKSFLAPLEFKFSTVGSKLAERQGQNGSYELDGSFKGFVISQSLVSTKSSSINRSADVVSQVVDGKNLTLSLAKDWANKLKSSDFPVIIDPTVFNTNVGLNFVNNASSGATCTSGTTGCGNRIGHDGVLNNIDWRFAYQVTVPNAPGSSDYLTSAVLHMELGVPPDGITGSEQVKVTRASCNNNFSCIDMVYGETAGTATTTSDIDLADMYRKAVAASETSPWLLVRGEEGGTVDKYKDFDYTKTKITFTYETLPGQSLIDASNQSINVPQDGGTITSTQPTLASLSSSDPDGPGPQKYRYIIGTSFSNLTSNPLKILPSVSGVVADSGTLSTRQWVVPDNVLKDGTTYYWQAMVWDNYSVTPIPWVYSPTYSFRVDLRNGKDSTQAFDSVGGVNVDFATGNVNAASSSHSMSSLAGNMGLNFNYNSPLRSRPGLVGEYYNDPGATRTFPAANIAATYSRLDPNVQFDWAAGSPYAGVISSDNFLVKWSGWFVAPAAGTYLFGTNSDDGSRIFINNASYLDSWGGSATNLYGAGVALTAGQVVQIRYEYAEWTGNAKAEMWVKTADGTTVTPRIIPSSMLQTGPRSIGTAHGLVGRYYTDPGGIHTFPAAIDDPTRLFLARTDTSINQNWGLNSPVPNGPTDNFMVRWTGQFTAPLADTYTFGVGSDDGARVYINGTLMTNAWSDHGASPIVYGSSIALTQGQSVNITVEYYENTSAAQMGLYVREQSLGTFDVPVDTNWLSPQAQILPDGWNVSLDGINTVGYSFANITSGGVTIYDSNGQSHEYKFQNGGFVPPINESGQLRRNGDGTITLQDVDGSVYLFATDGSIKSATKQTDDRNPSALQYVYGSTNGSLPRLQKIIDGVNTGRTMSVYYGGDSNCPTVPSGFLASNQTNFICGVTSTDGRTTGFFYTSGSSGAVLSRIALPGDTNAESTDYQYTSSLLSGIRNSLANDAVFAGVRAQDGTEVSTITYDSLGRASSVTLPAATAGATRMSHTFDYLVNNASQMHIVGATEPNGFSRKVTYDGSYRTVADIDVANLTATNEWDNTKDLLRSTTDPAGLKSTTIYDYADRVTDRYGPAPSAWFGTNGLPLTTPTDFTPQVPHTQNVYEENINGMSAAYYDLDISSVGSGISTKVLFGSPKLHGTGVGSSNGDIVKNWASAAPYSPVGSKGWGVSLTGWIHLTTAGVHSFRINSDDGARLWVNDTLTIDDWNDGALRNHPTGTFNNNGSPADKWYRVRLDYYNKAVSGVLDTDAQLNLFMTPPGGTETSALGTILKPNYGLVTTAKEYDSNASVGDRIVASNYGANPELGLVNSSTVDPSGLALTTNYNYENQGAAGSFLRQTAKYLPGANTSISSTATQYTYYTASDTRDNPCTPAIEAIPQAGMLRVKTDPDPDGIGTQTSRTIETIYDASGRETATRVNSDNWTCITFDARGRMTQKVYAANSNGSSRTLTFNYAVGGNPLITSVRDSAGTLETTSDLLGRVTGYRDTMSATFVTGQTVSTYDNLGRLVSKNSPKFGLEELTYDNYNRLVNHKLDGVIYATVSYDAFSRISQVTYPAAGQQKLVVGRDNLGRTSSMTYTLGDGSTTSIDTVSRSQSGKIISGTELGLAKSYIYDKAGRLTRATLGSNAYAYSFATPSASVCNQSSANLNANKSGNRTSQTVNGVTTTYCYNMADRLVSSSDQTLTTPTYDTHGNTTQLGTDFNTDGLSFSYDSSDRSTLIQENLGTDYNVQINRDAADRVINHFVRGKTTSDTYYGYTSNAESPDFIMDANTNVVERYVNLPGGVLLTVKSGTSRVYSLTNIHGDVMQTTNQSGTSTGTFVYDPFGKQLGTTIPANLTNGSGSYGHVGQFQKMDETKLTNQPQIMGARIYIPTLGRFLQADPVEGGTANNYAYVSDPVNYADLNGQWGIGGAWKWVGKNADKIGIGLTLVSLGACIVATAGVCTGVAVATALAGGIATTAGARNRGESWGRSLAEGGLDAGIGLWGAKDTQAVRWFGEGRNYTSVGKALTKGPGRGRLVTLFKGVVKDQIYQRVVDYGWRQVEWR